MILHLVDDEKIVDRIISVFEEALPKQNIFICFISQTHASGPRFISSTDNVYFVIDKKIPSNLDLSNVSKVIIHFLSLDKINFFVNHVSRKLPTYWILWGADLYNSLLFSKGMALYDEPRYLNWKLRLYMWIAPWGYSTRSEKKYLTFIENYINCFIADCKQEYQLMQHYLGKVASNLVYKEFFYYSIDEILGKQLIQCQVKGNVILLGNSASFTNNHYYAMKILSKLNLGDKNIVTPISYSGTAKYRTHVKKIGRRLFGSKYSALESFLSLADYNELMITAEVCVFGSWRQEAVGNIVIALYLGAKVFLSNRSVLLSFFRDLGILIFELELITTEQLITPLTCEERQMNRNILLNRYNKERQMQIIRDYWGN